jgi:hypothetical protein
MSPVERRPSSKRNLMPESKKTPKPKKSKSETISKRAQLDIVFAGPLLFVPEVTEGNITGLEVFAPCNGHHVGAVFMPGVLFTDAELDDPKCERWPEPESFSLLDPHSYSIELTQQTKKPQRPFPVAAIPETNHKVKPGRRLSGDWDHSIAVRGHLSGWTSHRLSKVTEGLFHGADAPTCKMTASLHRLTYAGITAAELYGAPSEPRAYLRNNAARGGTLIIVGEIPYQATLLHERRAIDAIANLAGLEFHLAKTAPSPYQTRLMNHVESCGLSIILA